MTSNDITLFGQRMAPSKKNRQQNVLEFDHNIYANMKIENAKYEQTNSNSRL